MTIRRTHALLLPTLLATACIVACTAAPSEEAGTTDEGAFTEGNYVQENDPHYWAPSTFEEFTRAEETFGVVPPPTLAVDDPLTIRLQTWIDRVDTIVRADIQRQIGAPLAAPKPIAKVLVSKSTFNAWVSSVPTCVGASAGTLRDPGSTVFVGRSSVQGGPGFAPESCIHPTTWTRDGFVKFWNDAKPDCSLAPTADGVNVVGKACTFAPGTEAGGEMLMVSATGQYIQFTTVLLAEIDEPTLAVVVAHELGHYYRGHTTEKGASRYNFWYQRDAAQKKTPVAAKNSAELQAAYAEVVQGVAPAGGPGFAGKYSARLRPLLLDGIAPLLSERKEADFVCAAARDALGPWTAEIQTEAPSEAARKAFLDFEAKLQKCAPAMALGGEPNARSVSAGAVLFAGAKFRPGPKTKVSIGFGDNVGAFLSRLDVSARELDAKAAKLLKRMRDNGIGLYTVEQEADDFAMEVSTKLGLSVDDVLGGWLDFMAAADRLFLRRNTAEEIAAYYKSIGEYDAPSCGALLKDNFTKDDGAGHRVPVTLSLGDLAEPHHTSCYRLWNLSREAGVHRYVAGPKQDALLPAWADLKAEAASLTASAPDPVVPDGAAGGAGAAAAAKKTFVRH